MDDTEQVNQTIVRIYSSPGNDASWDSAVESINQLIGGRATAYLLVDNQKGIADVSSSFGYSATTIARYSGPDGAALEDVRTKYLHKLIPGQVFREMEFIPDRDEWNSFSWNRFEREEMGIYYCMSAQISSHGIWSDYISVNRLESKGPNTDSEKHNLRLLLPHLARAAELHRAFNQLEQSYGAVLGVLNKFLVGLIIIDKHDRVVIANTAAREIADTSGAYKLTQASQLQFNNAETALQFSGLTTQINQTVMGCARSNGGQFTVKSKVGCNDILLEVLPIRDDGFSDCDNLQGTAVFVMDPSRSKIYSTEGLKQIFKLTSSQGKVIDLLFNGHSVNEIADIRNTNPNTIRQQLKATYQKSGTKGQLDLMRKAMKANPPIDRGELSNTKSS